MLCLTLSGGPILPLSNMITHPHPHHGKIHRPKTVKVPSTRPTLTMSLSLEMSWKTIDKKRMTQSQITMHNQMISLVDPMTCSQMMWCPLSRQFAIPENLSTKFVMHHWITTPSPLKLILDWNPWQQQLFLILMETCECALRFSYRLIMVLR